MTRPLLIIKVGTTVPGVRRKYGDFEDWFAKGLGFEKSEVQVVDLLAEQKLPKPQAVCGAIVTGSSEMITEDPAWNTKLESWLKSALDRSLPLLAVCYGHQALAQAAGGRADWNLNGREIGSVSIQINEQAERDPLLCELGPSFIAQESHSQSVVDLPPGAVLLAGNSHDPHQCFRIGQRAWGMQFHPEFDADITAGYIVERRAAIDAEGLNSQELLNQLTDDPTGERILKRFGALVRSWSGESI